MDRIPLPRLVASALAERLRVMPAVVVTGARQAGKSTLAQELTPGRRRYYSLDELDVLQAARHDPEVLLEGDQPITLDEVQREPDLLHAVKRAIDRDRQPGRFLLTGSANLLLMHKVSESLAGRASYLNLWPMTRREQEGQGKAGIWGELLDAEGADWIDALFGNPDNHPDWGALTCRGGFPYPSLHLGSDRERAIWFDGYVRTYLERDLHRLSMISALPDFGRLMRVASLRLGQLVNQSQLGRAAGLPQATTHRYLNLLEMSYLLVRVPAYAANRTKRLIKSPKLYWADTGIAMHLAQEDEPRGAHLENLVLQDLLAWRDGRLDRAEIFHWRTTLGEEVDFVIEAEDRLLPIEVKATKRARLRDTVHLRTFRKQYGRKSRPGLLIHAGQATEWITPDVLAAPWWRIL